MTITLADIEQAEQILEAYRSGDMESLSANDIQFVAQPMLPVLLKLVREMLEIIQHSKAAINIRGHKMKGCEVEDCWACMVIRRIDRLVEHMESDNVD